MSSVDCETCGRQYREGGVCPDCNLQEDVPVVVVADAAVKLISKIEFASPFEIREAARQLDDIGNDPRTSAKLRPLYRALSDVVKSWR